MDWDIPDERQQVIGRFEDTCTVKPGNEDHPWDQNMWSSLTVGLHFQVF